jgi:hypothetical protein
MSNPFAAAAPETVLSATAAVAPRAERPKSRRAPMFGHRPVGWGRHAGAVFAAAFASSLVQVLVGTMVVVATMAATGGSLGPRPVTVAGIGAFFLWCSTFIIVVGEIALFFTVARALLSAAKRNFGAAYLALGLVMGMVEASILGVVKGATSSREFIFAAATGVLAGFVYWLVAAQDREAVAIDRRDELPGVFG